MVIYKMVNKTRWSLKRVAIKSELTVLHATETWGQFNKTFTLVIYKCVYSFQSLKQWLHL